MPASDFRGMSMNELSVREGDLRDEVARLVLKRNGKRLEKPSELIKARRELAQLLTVKTEKIAAERKGASE